MQSACAILSSVACLGLQYFSKLSHKRHDFREKKSYWTQNVYFDFLYKIYPNHFSLYEEMSEIWSKMYIAFHVKYPLLLSDFNESLSFSTDFRKNAKYQFSWKSVQWNRGFFHADRRTEGQAGRHNEANSRFPQFCERTLNVSIT